MQIYGKVSLSKETYLWYIFYVGYIGLVHTVTDEIV